MRNPGIVSEFFSCKPVIGCTRVFRGIVALGPEAAHHSVIALAGGTTQRVSGGRCWRSRSQAAGSPRVAHGTSGGKGREPLPSVRTWVAPPPAENPCTWTPNTCYKQSVIPKVTNPLSLSPTPFFPPPLTFQLLLHLPPTSFPFTLCSLFNLTQTDLYPSFYFPAKHFPLTSRWLFLSSTKSYYHRHNPPFPVLTCARTVCRHRRLVRRVLDMCSSLLSTINRKSHLAASRRHARAVPRRRVQTLSSVTAGRAHHPTPPESRVPRASRASSPRTHGNIISSFEPSEPWVHDSYAWGTFNLFC